MTDQLIIGDKGSFDGFEASLASRTIGMPSKKSIKETVPFSNVTYDFSKINGEVYWEERELEYVFEIIAPTPERLEELKAAFSNWVMNVFQEEIHDPFIPDHHFIGTFEDIEYDDEEGLDKTTATVTFTAYPYKIANIQKVYEVECPVAVSPSVVIVNESSHPIVPTIKAETDIILNVDGEHFEIAAGEVTNEDLRFPAGAVSVSITNTSNEAHKVTILFYEEVF